MSGACRASGGAVVGPVVKEGPRPFHESQANTPKTTSANAAAAPTGQKKRPIRAFQSEFASDPVSAFSPPTTGDAADVAAGVGGEGAETVA